MSLSAVLSLENKILAQIQPDNSKKAPSSLQHFFMFSNFMPSEIKHFELLIFRGKQKNHHYHVLDAFNDIGAHYTEMYPRFCGQKSRCMVLKAASDVGTALFEHLVSKQ